MGNCVFLQEAVADSDFSRINHAIALSGRYAVRKEQWK